MTNLADILKEMDAKRAIINAEINPDIATARNMRDRQKSAALRVEQLQVEYRNALLGRTVFIVMYGAESSKLAGMAQKDFGSFSADAETIFQRIASEVPVSSYSNKNASPALFDIISHALEGVAAEAGVSSFPQPMFKTSKHARKLTNKEELTSLIKQVVSEDVGSEIIAVHAVTATYLTALEAGFAGKVFPVVLHTPDVTYAAKLMSDIEKRLNRPVYAITVKGEDVIKLDQTVVMPSSTKTALKNALTSIKKALGGK